MAEVLALVSLCLAAWPVGAAAEPASPQISAFVAAAPAVVHPGATTTVTASVTAAATCTLSSKPKVAGLPVSFACEEGTVSRLLTMPIPTGKKAIRYKLTLTAIGTGHKAKATTIVVVKPATIEGVSAVGANAGVACALLSPRIACWGDNVLGQLGIGKTTEVQDTPVELPGISDAAQIAVGGGHNCAVLSTGRIDCWGANQEGQLGDGTITGPETCLVRGKGLSPVPCSKTPAEVGGINDAIQAAADDRLTCTLLSGGNIDCWGDNYDGELGNGESQTLSDLPVEVQGINDATQVTVGGVHTCALLSTGHVECWGENSYGELGNGTIGVQPDIPVEVEGISHATQVSAGTRSTCAVLSSGHVECWGNGEFGALGNGTTSGSDVPVEVLGIDNATEVSTNYAQACTLLSTGHVDCWGHNEDGELGDGTNTGPEGCTRQGVTTPCSVTPVEVQGISNATQITAAGYSACALLSTGPIYCWGENIRGELGNDTTHESDFPVEVL